MIALKELHTKKGRDESGLFTVEGEKFIDEIPVEIEILRFLFSKDFADQKGLSEYENRAKCEVIRNSLFKKLADTVNPQGIIAVCKKPEVAPGSFENISAFVVIGECLSDPGNVGALMRTAAAVEADGFFLTEGSADPLSPKVIRASAGAALRLPVVSNICLEEALSYVRGFPVYGAHPKGEYLPYELNLAEPFSLVIGNESRGLSDEAIACATSLVRLPMANATDSLNASVAGSVLMYEALRQRYNF